MASPGDAALPAGLAALFGATPGAIGFDRYMDGALYGEGGFFHSGGGAGRRADFITSPEVGSLFGAVLARAIDAACAGVTEPVTVVEVGAGRGTLARAVLAAPPGCLGHYLVVETSEQLRSHHPNGVTSLSAMPERLDGPVVVIANELLDNIATRLVRYGDGGWTELTVQPAGDARTLEFAERELGATDAARLAQLVPDPGEGAVVPLHDDAAAWLAAALGIGRGPTTVICFDYFAATTAALAERAMVEWFRTYRSHDRGGDVLASPGSQDLTTEVAMDQLAQVQAPTTVESQADFLTRHGIAELVEAGRKEWLEHGALGGLSALKGRSAAVEAEALLDPAGLGGFTAVVWERG